MAIKRRLEDVSVVVSVEAPWLERPNTPSYNKRWLTIAEELTNEIRRHANRWNGIAIKTEYVNYCEFCGDTSNEPLWCCTKAQNEIAAQEREEFGL